MLGKGFDPCDIFIGQIGWLHNHGLTVQPRYVILDDLVKTEFKYSEWFMGALLITKHAMYRLLIPKNIPLPNYCLKTVIGSVELPLMKFFRIYEDVFTSCVLCVIFGIHAIPNINIFSQ